MKPRYQTTRAPPYHTRDRGSSGARETRSHACAALLGCTALLCAQRARAHESPAEPPVFEPGDCISVLDKREESAFEIAYTVRADDVELTYGDIPVADAKTHQFFAFRGAIATRGLGHELYPFAVEPDVAQRAIALPIWITSDDVKRAAQANDGSAGGLLSEYEIPLDAVLTSNADLGGLWLRVTADEARVPITAAQAAQGARFELQDVEPGLYTIAGYIFSPPYNSWAPRAGLVKVIDGSSDVPAAAIDPVHGLLYPTQGRRVAACVDAPEGTRVRGLFRVEERPEAGEVEWLPAQAIANGRIELCFHTPRAELTGSLRLLLELESPSGEKTRAYAPDTITALNGQGRCQDTAEQCCGFPGAAVEGGEEPGRDDSGSAAAGAGSRPGVPGNAPESHAKHRAHEGCAASAPRAGGRSSLFALTAVAFGLLRRRSGSRRRRIAG